MTAALTVFRNDARKEALWRACKVDSLNAFCRTVFHRRTAGAVGGMELSGELWTAAMALDGRACFWKATLFLRAKDGRTTALDGRRCWASAVRLTTLAA